MESNISSSFGMSTSSLNNASISSFPYRCSASLYLGPGDGGGDVTLFPLDSARSLYKGNNKRATMSDLLALSTICHFPFLSVEHCRVLINLGSKRLVSWCRQLTPIQSSKEQPSRDRDIWFPENFKFNVQFRHSQMLLDTSSLETFSTKSILEKAKPPRISENYKDTFQFLPYSAGII